MRPREPDGGPMLLGHLSTAATAIPSWLIAWALVGLLCPNSEARAEDPPAACEDEAGLAVLFSPVAPWKGAPVRVVFAADRPVDGELSVITPEGKVAAKSDGRHGGPPYFWFAEIDSPEVGTWQAKLTRENASLQCRDLTRDIVVQGKEPPRPGTAKGVWPLRGEWNRETENLYSAWIEKLFDAPPDEELSWKAMDGALRGRWRKHLFNKLSQPEDQK